MARAGFGVAGLLFCIVGFIAALNKQPIVPWIPLGMMFIVLGNTVGRR